MRSKHRQSLASKKARRVKKEQMQAMEFTKAKRASIGDIHHWASGDWKKEIHGWSKVKPDIKAHLEKLHIKNIKRGGESGLSRMSSRQQMLEILANGKEGDAVRKDADIAKKLLPETRAAAERMSRFYKVGRQNEVDRYKEEVVDLLAGKYRDHVLSGLPKTSKEIDSMRARADALRIASEDDSNKDWKRALSEAEHDVEDAKEILSDEADDLDSEADDLDSEAEQQEQDAEDKVEEFRNDLDSDIEDLSEKIGAKAEAYLERYIEAKDAVRDKYVQGVMEDLLPLKEAKIGRARRGRDASKIFKRITRNVQKAGAHLSDLFEFEKAQRRHDGEIWTQPSGRRVTKKNGVIIPVKTGKKAAKKAVKRPVPKKRSTKEQFPPHKHLAILPYEYDHDEHKDESRKKFASRVKKGYTFNAPSAGKPATWTVAKKGRAHIHAETIAGFPQTIKYSHAQFAKIHELGVAEPIEHSGATTPAAKFSPITQKGRDAVAIQTAVRVGGYLFPEWAKVKELEEPLDPIYMAGAIKRGRFFIRGADGKTYLSDSPRLIDPKTGAYLKDEPVLKVALKVGANVKSIHSDTTGKIMRPVPGKPGHYKIKWDDSDIVTTVRLKDIEVQ